MTPVTHDERFRQPIVKRLGLDDGWWFFCPHFLNLGIPLVFVDACLIPEANRLGLEPFGARRPETPLPPVDLRVELRGEGVNFYSTDRRPRYIIGHWFRKLQLERAVNAPSVGVIVGDSYALQLSWSALWRCRIGTASNVQIEPE